MAKLRYNPTREHLDPLLNTLFAEAQAGHRKHFERIVHENQSLGGTVDGFRYHGVIHALVPLPQFRGVKVHPLDPRLVDQYERYLDRKRRTEAERTSCRNGLSIGVSRCKTPRDTRDLLPEALVNEIPGLSQLRRDRPEGFILQGLKPNLQEEFNAAVELAISYQAMRFIR